jgi:hypothetical protein
LDRSASSSATPEQLVGGLAEVVESWPHDSRPHKKSCHFGGKILVVMLKETDRHADARFGESVKVLVDLAGGVLICMLQKVRVFIEPLKANLLDMRV